MDPLFPISCPFPFAGISTTAVYTLSLHDALPISLGAAGRGASAPRGDRPVRLAAVPAGGPPSRPARPVDRKSTRLNSSHVAISYAVFCLIKKKHKNCRHATLMLVLILLQYRRRRS